MSVCYGRYLWIGPKNISQELPKSCSRSARITRSLDDLERHECKIAYITTNSDAIGAKRPNQPQRTIPVPVLVPPTHRSHQPPPSAGSCRSLSAWRAGTNWPCCKHTDRHDTISQTYEIMHLGDPYLVAWTVERYDRGKICRYVMYLP